MLTKMKAVKAIDEMDGKFSVGDTFWVNDERRFVLTRLGLAEVAADQSLDPIEKPAPETVVSRAFASE